MIDLIAIIRELYAERERLTRVIAKLEFLADLKTGDGAKPPQVEQPDGEQVAPTRLRRRGRSSMGDEERKQVSERMRAYWAARRAAIDTQEDQTATSQPS